MTVRGWCPTLFEPMESGDGWLLRVKPRRARLTAAQARVVAEVADRHGNGRIGLTNRANLQLRGFTAGTIAPATDALLAAGLADADPGVERRRNLLVPPLLGLDPALSPALPDVIAGLEAMLAGPALAGLPPKFGIVVDGGGALPLAGERGDVRVLVRGETAWVGVDGRDRGIACAASETARIAARLAREFLGGVRSAHPPPPPRKGGGDNGLSPPALAGGDGGGSRLTGETVFRSAGRTPDTPSQHRRGETFRTVHFAFGRLTAAALAGLAGLAAEIRVTPWRSVLLPGVDPAHDGAVAALGGLTPGHPLALVAACPGRPACSSATVATETDAVALLAGWRPDVRVHLSGCAKGCAHPGPAAITLAGQPDGRYALIRNGRSSDPPMATGLTIADAAHLLRQTAA